MAPSLQASQIDAVPANFPHEASTIFIGTRPVGHGVDKRAVLVEDIGDERHDAIDLLPAVGKAFQKHRHVVVGVLPCVAARPRAEQHHPLDAVAVERVECGAKALQKSDRWRERQAFVSRTVVRI